MAKLKKRMSSSEVLAYLEHEHGPMAAEATAKLEAHSAAIDAQIEVLQLLRNARAKSQLTQLELAAISGVSQPELSRFESGTGNPTLATLSKISSALGYRLTLTKNENASTRALV
jgi:DNA-binding phage protein